MEKSKKRNIIVCIAVAVVLIIAIVVNMTLNKSTKNSDKIPQDYIAVFHGGAGEITYETYIYKIDNDQDNYGFKYINTESTTVSWGSSEWTTRITGTGTVDWTDDVFDVAYKNNAYSYVTSKGKQYTIEEFGKRFIMD